MESEPNFVFGGDLFDSAIGSKFLREKGRANIINSVEMVSDVLNRHTKFIAIDTLYFRRAFPRASMVWMSK